MPNKVSRIFIAEDMPGFAGAPAAGLLSRATAGDPSPLGAPQAPQNFVASFNDVPQFLQKAMARLLVGSSSTLACDPISPHDLKPSWDQGYSDAVEHSHAVFIGNDGCGSSAPRVSNFQAAVAVGHYLETNYF
jgi:hypothetical protein